jgi:cytochrome c
MANRAFLTTVFLATGLLLPAAAMGADPAAGKAVFTSQCGVCHSVVPDKNGVGPSLFGLVGRKSGSVLGFHYSAANHAANIVWDEQTLDPYLKSPMTTIPGTTMGYAGVKDDQKRADLIAYLATLK